VRIRRCGALNTAHDSLHEYVGLVGRTGVIFRRDATADDVKRRHQPVRARLRVRLHTAIQPHHRRRTPGTAAAWCWDHRTWTERKLGRML
jgi:hypothetical protein